MNEFLNNVFTAESVDAIKNAHKISPSPEQKAEVEYSEPEVEHIEVSVSETVTTSEPEGQIGEKALSALEKKLLAEIAKQSERISTIIASQNEMIGEFNKLQEEVTKLKSQPTVQAAEPVKTEQPQAAKVENKEEKKQQTGAGEGLNPEDYNVEDIFYFGNK